MSPPTSFYYNGFDNSQTDTTQSDFESSFDSSFKWAIVGSLVYMIVAAIAVMAIVYAIIDCLKKVGTAIPAYARLETKEENHDQANSKTDSGPDNIELAVTPDFQEQQSVSRAGFATMERFLSGIAKEKPMRFSPEELGRFTNDYSTILGSGSFGIVYKGEFPNGVRVAVKVINNSDKGIEEQFKAEISTIGRTYHINLVRLHGFCFHPGKIALVYEYVERGSLDKLLFCTNTQDIEWSKLRDIAIGTAKGLAYLHEECQKRIVHYDIKPENVLLDQNLNPKVADFGLAKLCSREKSGVSMTHFRGTRGYAAPEMWRLDSVTYKCDVYSFGIVLFEIVGRRRHFDERYNESQQWLPRWTWDMFKNNELALMLSFCGIEEKDKEEAEKMLKVALWCVQYSPEDRPRMSSVVKMLEGDMEISPPPFPFEHLVSRRQNITPNYDSDDDWDTIVPIQ